MFVAHAGLELLNLLNVGTMGMLQHTQLLLVIDLKEVL